MSDLRLITVQEDGEVTFTPELMYVPLTDREAALQRVVLCLLNTPGTMVDAPGWGGGSLKLYLSPRKLSINDTKKDVEEVVHKAQMSLEKTERGGPYQITNLNVANVERLERGFRVLIRVDFAEAISQTISIPGNKDVVS